MCSFLLFVSGRPWGHSSLTSLGVLVVPRRNSPCSSLALPRTSWDCKTCWNLIRHFPIFHNLLLAVLSELKWAFHCIKWLRTSMLKVWNRCQYAFDMHKPEFRDAWQTDDMVIGEKTWENTGKFWICTESRKCRAQLECVVLKRFHVVNQNEGLNLSHLETTSWMIRQASSFYGQSSRKCL